MNEWLPGMTSYRITLDLSVLSITNF